MIFPMSLLLKLIVSQASHLPRKLFLEQTNFSSKPRPSPAI